MTDPDTLRALAAELCEAKEVRHKQRIVGAPLKVRLAAKITVDPKTGCWLWEKSTNARGYGIVGVGDRCLLAHRVAYEEWHGPIPDGLELDHLCLVKRCINPDHLEPVTNAENARRRKGLFKRTHCPQGHAYEGDNLYTDPAGAQRCRTCRREHNRKRDQSRRAAALLAMAEKEREG